MKNFLICGAGNIAQRHFRNLKTLLPDCVIDIYCSKREQYRIFDNNLNITLSNNLLDFYAINEIYHDLDEALLNKYDAAFVCSLPPERIDIAIEIAKRGFNLFIEKPLSNNLAQIYRLQDKVEENNLKCAMGFQMRFHPNLQKLKNMVDNNEFGDIYRIEAYHCNSIYNWTNGRDLKDFYALKNEAGGGVLNSQSHEIDYLTWIFGQQYPISAIYSNRLGYGVEDNITILSSLELDNKCIPIIINLDFLLKVPTRKITIHGTEKIETFDLMDRSVVWNDLFLAEMKASIKSLDGEWQHPLAKLEDGISSLEYVMDIKNNFTKI